MSFSSTIKTHLKSLVLLSNETQTTPASTTSRQTTPAFTTGSATDSGVISPVSDQVLNLKLGDKWCYTGDDGGNSWLRCNQRNIKQNKSNFLTQVTTGNKFKLKALLGSEDAARNETGNNYCIHNHEWRRGKVMMKCDESFDNASEFIVKKGSNGLEYMSMISGDIELFCDGGTAHADKIPQCNNVDINYSAPIYFTPI
jgi:hypothetical protein